MKNLLHVIKASSWTRSTTASFTCVTNDSSADLWFTKVRVSWHCKFNSFFQRICVQAYEPQLEFTENQTRSSQLLQFLDIYGTRRFITMFTNPWWWRQYAPLKRRSTIIWHGSISQKTILNMFTRAHHQLLSWFRSIQSTTAQSIAFILTLWRRTLSKCYLRIQSVPQREHNTSPLQRSTG
jgi:hypothetical protein